jgi:TolB protein
MAGTQPARGDHDSPFISAGHAARRWPGLRLPRRGLAVLLPSAGLLCAATTVAAAFAVNASVGPNATQATAIESAAAQSTAAPTSSEAVQPNPSPWGSLVLDARESGWDHLYAYTPGSAGLAPFLAGEWNDRHPAAAPDGSAIAFASDRDGAWDIYILDLPTGAVRRVTETLAYEGWPSWSPDGRWLAIESYADGDLDIWVLSVDGSSPPIQLTNEAGADTSPAWDPQGRRIAFISDRSGQPDLYLADLDIADENRVRNLTQTTDAAERDPAFSPSGNSLAYTSTTAGIDRLLVMDLARRTVAEIGQGVAPTWSPDGRLIAATIRAANRVWSALYPVEAGVDMPPGLPPVAASHRAAWLPDGGWAAAPAVPPSDQVSLPAAEDRGRADLSALGGVQPPSAQLSERAVQAFSRLREQVALRAGWDLLSKLAYAFVGVNDPLPPGWEDQSWLQTGRAFAFAVEPYRAGWVEIVREDVGSETYWRVYLRAAQQDGSAGEPLREKSWDLDARYRGDAPLYDQGGAPKPAIPSGYYLDLTSLAADFGFERLPALSNWRRYYPGARFNEFALRQGLSWEQAMLELYPAAAIATPTPFRTPTLTPTPTLRPTGTPSWWRWRTPTPSPFPTFAPTATLP